MGKPPFDLPNSAGATEQAFVSVRGDKWQVLTECMNPGSWIFEAGPMGERVTGRCELIDDGEGRATLRDFTRVDRRKIAFADWWAEVLTTLR